MKRGAEKQISKLDQLSEDEENEEVPSEFKKADESTLATRRIRGLPKRVLAGSITATVNGTSMSESESSTGTPKFSGFAGFGTQSTSSPFTFTATTPKPSLASEPLPQPPTTSSLASDTMAVSTTASTTAKTLSSFLGAPPDTSANQKLNPTANATSLAFPLAVPSSQINVVPPSASSEPANDLAVKYFTDLRGLNVSFISALSRAMSEDPFVDFSQLLEQYKSKRSIVQSDYDKTKKPEASSKETNKATICKTTLDTTKPISPPIMPAPPASFSFAGTAFNASSFKSVMSNNGGGFKPSLSTMPDALSPFKFGTTTSTQSLEYSNAPSIGSASRPLSLGSTTTATPSFGVKSDLSNPFKFSAPSTSTADGTTPALGSSNLFSQQPSLSTVAKSSTISSSSSSVFGKQSGNGSIGNPVGFGFGANTKSSDGVDIKSSSSGFVFGQPSSSSFGKIEAEKEPKKVENNEDGEEEAAGIDGSGATESDETTKVRVSSPTPHDVEGEGEEEEETIHSVRLKAYRMRKADEKAGQSWVELGVGYLRLKRHKETDARRMLLRNSSTGKININFKLYPGFKVTQTKKSLTFIGHDNGVAQTYNVRLPNEDQVYELKVVIEREVALIKVQD